MRPTSFLSGFAVSFLYFFLLDGALSVLDDLLRATGNPVALVSALRELVALSVLLWAIPIFGLLILSPRLKRRCLYPPALFALWAGFTGCFPIYLLELQGNGVWLTLLQVIIGAAAIYGWKQSGQQLWNPDRRGFTWQNSLCGVVAAGCLALMMMGALVGSAAEAVENRTGGYVTLRPSGLYLTEKIFRREDKEIRLVGMIHVAKSSFYDSVAEDMQGRPAVVLLEGVSDEKGLLKKQFSYRRLADFMGIAAQEGSSFASGASADLHDDEEDEDSESPLQFKQADLDISVFQPQTLLLVEEFGHLLDSADWREVVTRLTDKNSILNNEDAVQTAMGDIIGTRNKHLMNSLHTSLTQTNLVIVPWGAAHLADIQKELEQMGFQEVGSKARLALSFLPL